MYFCKVTGKMSKPGDKLNKIVLETRPKVYMKYVKDEDTNRWHEVEAGRGYETVAELDSSDEGVQLWESWSPEERQMFIKHL